MGVIQTTISGRDVLIETVSVDGLDYEETSGGPNTTTIENVIDTIRTE